MDLQLDRNRLFALLGALEDDLRQHIRDHLLKNLPHESVINGPTRDKAEQRLQDDHDAVLSGATLIDYIDLSDELDILNRFKNQLPADLRDALKASAAQLNGLVPVRNRVAHRRPLLADDLDQSTRILTQLSSNGFAGVNLSGLLERAQNDRTWMPRGLRFTEPPLVLNNLPLVDFDETGLVGRSRQLNELSKILRHLHKSRMAVVTVLGPGGMGKTALALQALHDLVNDPLCPYDLVSWVSLKTEMLTPTGVKQIRDSIRTLEEAIPRLMESLDESFDGDSDDLHSSLEGITTLLAIDNIETVSGAEVLEFIYSLPNTVSYLLTSRQGLGELERRHPVFPLDQSEAGHLFRKLANSRHLEPYARMESNRLAGIVDQLGCSPLAIKWFASGLEAGFEAQELLRHRDDLVEFCVKSVFDTLCDEGKEVAVILHAIARPITVQMIHQYAKGLEPDDVRRGIQDLLKRSLLTSGLLSGSIVETYTLTEILDYYLRAGRIAPSSEIQRIRDLERQTALADERLRRDSASKPFSPNVVVGGPEHRASKLALRSALSSARSHQPEDIRKAILEVDEIGLLDPDFWELHRVRGFLLSIAHENAAANDSYLKAVALAPDAEAQARVKYFFATHLLRSASTELRAADVAREAHDVLQAPHTAFEYGRAVMYEGDYETARDLFESGLESSDSGFRTLVFTTLLNCLKRHAEYYAWTQKDPDSGGLLLIEALNRANNETNRAIDDDRLKQEFVKLISQALNIGAKIDDTEILDKLAMEVMSIAPRIDTSNIRLEDLNYVAHHLDLIEAKHPKWVEETNVRSVLEQSVLLNWQPVPTTPRNELERPDDRNIGVVDAWNAQKKYGFISTDSGTRLYFNWRGLSSGASMSDVAVGREVAFTAERLSDGRSRAINLVLSQDMRDFELLTNRQIEITRVYESNQYAFARDIESDVTVFIGRHMVKSDEQWLTLFPGRVLRCDVEVLPGEKFRAKDGSIEL